MDNFLNIAKNMYEGFRQEDLSDDKTWVRFMKNWEYFNDRYNSKLLDALIEVVFKYLKGELKGKIKNDHV